MRGFLLALFLFGACDKDTVPPPCEAEECCPAPDNCPLGFLCDPVTRVCLPQGRLTDAGADGP